VLAEVMVTGDWKALAITNAAVGVTIGVRWKVEAGIATLTLQVPTPLMVTAPVAESTVQINADDAVLKVTVAGLSVLKVGVTIPLGE